MNLHFKNNKLEKACTNQRQMQQRFQMKILKKLKLRLKALQAHETFGDVIEIDKSGRWHPLVGNYAGCWGAWLNGNNWIIVVNRTGILGDSIVWKG